jgi:hypothetical protein
MDALSVVVVVPQLHYIIEMVVVVADADMEHINKTLVRSRDGFKLADAGKFSLEGFLIREGSAVNNLHSAVLPHPIASKPHLAVAAFSNAPNQLVIRNPYRRSPLIGRRDFARSIRLFIMVFCKVA